MWVRVDRLSMCVYAVCLTGMHSYTHAHTHTSVRTFRTKVGAGWPSSPKARPVRTASHARSMASRVENEMEEPAPPVASPCVWMPSRMRRVRSPKAAGVVVAAVAGASTEEDEAGGAVARTRPRPRVRVRGWSRTKAVAGMVLAARASAASSSADVDRDREAAARRIALRLVLLCALDRGAVLLGCAVGENERVVGHLIDRIDLNWMPSGPELRDAARSGLLRCPLGQDRSKCIMTHVGYGTRRRRRRRRKLRSGFCDARAWTSRLGKARKRQWG